MAESRASCSVDEIRERTNIVEIISPHVRLRKAGKRLAGLCPFHTDSAPSFSVDPEQGLWHCFGCRAGGNVFHFLMRAENLTFAEAARKLADRLGVRLRGGREDDRTRDLRDLLERINAEAAHFFRRQLADSLRARDYLRQRGLGDDLVAAFGLGWAPAEWDALYTHLRRQGYRDADLERAGLCTPRRSGDGCYDRFRGRVMFPILDAHERVIGFGGRILEGEEAKYINSPETPLFRKRRTLYAFPQARKAMGERERAIVVEGYFDAIACHAAGFTEAVATMGTALTEEHLEVLRRHTPRVYAAFDSDSAGMQAMLSSHQLFERARLEVRVVRLPAGRDPDSLLSEAGPEAFGRALNEAQPALDYRLALLVESHPDTPEGRLALMQQAVEVLGEVGNAVTQAEYVRRLAERCCQPNLERVGLMEQALHRELRKSEKTAARPPAARPSSGDASAKVERQVLAAMVHSEVCAKWLAGELSPGDFADDLHRRVFETMRPGAAAGSVDLQALLAQEQQAEVCALLSELALGDEPAPEAELREAAQRLGEWRDARRCRELTEKAQRGEASPQEYLELSELRRRHSAATARRSLGEMAR